MFKLDTQHCDKSTIFVFYDLSSEQKIGIEVSNLLNLSLFEAFLLAREEATEILGVSKNCLFLITYGDSGEENFDYIDIY